MPFALKVTLGSPEAVATTTLRPMDVPSRQDVSEAIPLALVVAGDPTTLPPPEVTAKVTVMPDTGMPDASRTTTLGGSATLVPTGADWVVWETATIVTGCPAVPVAVKVTGVTPAATARSVLVPGTLPRNQPPTAAVPVASVTWREPTTLPPPEATSKLTMTPGTPSPLVFRTRTVGGIGTRRPTGADWLLPAVTTICEPVGEVAVALKTTGLLATPLSSTRAASDCGPAAGPRIQLPTAATP